MDTFSFFSLSDICENIFVISETRSEDGKHPLSSISSWDWFVAWLVAWYFTVSPIFSKISIFCSFTLLWSFSIVPTITGGFINVSVLVAGRSLFASFIRYLWEWSSPVWGTTHYMNVHGWIKIHLISLIHIIYDII